MAGKLTFAATDHEVFEVDAKFGQFHTLALSVRVVGVWQLDTLWQTEIFIHKFILPVGLAAAIFCGELGRLRLLLIFFNNSVDFAAYGFIWAKAFFFSVSLCAVHVLNK